nr:PREDICTED: UDP-glucuronosyltransferase 2A1-like [Bemisia tabaci]
MNPFESLIQRWNVIPRALDVALSTDAMQSIIHSTDQYDVIITDLSFYQSCIVALGHKFNAPVINISPTAPSSYAASVSGNPIPFSVVPSKWAALPGGMKFFDRVFNTLISSWDLLGEFFYVQPKQEILMRKHFTYAGSEDLPPLREMLQNVSITLVNSHFSLGIPRSYAPNMVEVGGFHIQPKKRLADNLERFMNKAKNGVAYVSFGTLVQPHHLSNEKLLLISTALRKLKLHVILKCNYLSDADLQNAEGVLLLHWAPQQEILAHPNCVLFVTHGGYNSLIEVTWAGVPVLCIPIFSDQFHNAQIVEESGVGKILYQDQLTEAILAETVDSIIHDANFRNRAKELSDIIKDRPESPMERAIFWIEYVVRHKGAHHLKPASVYLNWYEDMLLDVIAVLLLATFVILRGLGKLFNACKKIGKSISVPTAFKFSTEAKEKSI